MKKIQVSFMAKNREPPTLPDKLKGVKVYYPNRDDWEEQFWKHNYLIWLTEQGCGSKNGTY
jgi:hypothetical protein